MDKSLNYYNSIEIGEKWTVLRHCQVTSFGCPLNVGKREELGWWSGFLFDCLGGLWYYLPRSEAQEEK